MRLVFIGWLMLSACATRAPSPAPQDDVSSAIEVARAVDPPSPDASATVPEPAAGDGEAAWSSGAVAEALRARHPQDVPDRAALRGMDDDADQTLRHLAHAGRPAVVAARAVAVMANDPLPDDVAPLLAVYDDVAAPDSARRAALGAMGALWPVASEAQRSALRARLASAIADGDPLWAPVAQQAKSALPEEAADRDARDKDAPVP